MTDDKRDSWQEIHLDLKTFGNQSYLQNIMFVGFRQVLQPHFHFSQEPKFNKKTTVN